MSNTTRVHFQINSKGDVKVVDVNGAGPECQNLTGEVEKALGTVDEKSRETTASAFEKNDPLKLTHENT